MEYFGQKLRKYENQKQEKHKASTFRELRKFEILVNFVKFAVLVEPSCGDFFLDSVHSLQIFSHAVFVEELINPGHISTSLYSRVKSNPPETLLRRERLKCQ